MKLIVTIFLLFVLFLSYSKFIKPSSLEYDKNMQILKEIKIVAFGDSITKGVGAKKSYPERLGEILKTAVINEGVPGETSDEGLKRLPKVLEKYKPDIVILCHGGNDILRRYNLADTKKNLQHMIELIHENNAKVLLIGVPNFSGFSMSVEKFYEELADEYDLLFIPEALAQIINNPDLKSDSVHPNDKGYELLASKVAALLLEGF
jgi:lysophospholipase L1-like esterase